MDRYTVHFEVNSLALSLAYLWDLVRQGKKSSPGMDGVTFRALRAVGSLAVGALWKVAHAVLEGHRPPDDWNHSLFCALAKTASFTDPDGSSWHLPKDIRPLAVVNADNRLVANLFRLPIAVQACRMVHPAQRGFLANRILLDNVLDVDLALRKAFAGQKGLLALFDLEAAFPSVSHQYIWHVLDTMGLPGPWLRALQSFYVGNVNHYVHNNKPVPLFDCSNGVRQGCPLSPVLFALVP
jgi:Reverse transcriptase (RNA-dependent DNA polymerase).